MESIQPARIAVAQRLRELRKTRKMSVRELAEKSGVSASLISKIEFGHVAPTIDSLDKLVRSLGMELWAFFSEAPSIDMSDQIVFRKADMSVSEAADASWRFALPRHPAFRVQLSCDMYNPRSRALENVVHQNDICGIVVSGELTLEIEGRGKFKLCSGDAYYIKAGVKHNTVNEGARPVKLVNAVALSVSAEPSEVHIGSEASKSAPSPEKEHTAQVADVRTPNPARSNLTVSGVTGGSSKLRPKRNS